MTETRGPGIPARLIDETLHHLSIAALRKPSEILKEGDKSLAPLETEIHDSRASDFIQHYFWKKGQSPLNPKARRIGRKKPGILALVDRRRELEAPFEQQSSRDKIKIDASGRRSIKIETGSQQVA
ncbi:hypothetical protein NP233_g3692 [Leucocoprinus birnbaumii]|uniref:Uncharacterized protein n=1 Tax=Leucocoprinus birnbaumii TaxID=56174 RepID=A0AAD5YY58_9AGAR|nr:hypothetical protein NP233_g3692 [Leucocoprinus birnbaumii]